MASMLATSVDVQTKITSPRERAALTEDQSRVGLFLRIDLRG